MEHPTCIHCRWLYCVGSTSRVYNFTKEAGGFGKFLEDALEAMTLDTLHDAGALFREANIEYG